MRDPIGDATNSEDNPEVGVQYSVQGEGCEFTAPRSSVEIDLTGGVATLGRRLASLNPDDDDYADDLAEVREDFPGPVFDAVVAEFEARFDALEDLKALKDEQTSFNMAMGDENSGGAGTQYRAISATTVGLVGETTPGFDTKIDSGGTNYEVDNDADLRFSQVNANDTEVMFDKEGRVTSLEVDIEVMETEMEIDFSTSENGDWDSLGKILTKLDEAEMERDNLQKVLDLDDDGMLSIRSGSGRTAVDTPRNLTPGQRTFLEKVVAYRQSEVDAIRGAISGIEEFEDPADGGRVYAEVVDNYHTDRQSLEGLRGALDRSLANQRTARNAVRDSVRDPADHLDTLVALAELEYTDAVDRGLTGAALAAYTGVRDAAMRARSAYTSVDPNNPASALLTSLIAQDDTGQALLDAVSTNYGYTVSNTDRLDAVEGNIGDIDSLEAEDLRLEGRIDTNAAGIEQNSMAIDSLEAEDVRLEGRIDTNTAHLEDHEERITTNEADIETNKAGIETNKTGIATNKAEIVRVEERVDSNWDAIGANQMDIATNRSNINGLRKGLDVATAGVAAAMALAALPDVEGARSFGVGLGTFDGKTAVAVGFSYGTERFTFKVGAATASGETGGSAGIGWSF